MFNQCLKLKNVKSNDKNILKEKNMNICLPTIILVNIIIK